MPITNIIFDLGNVIIPLKQKEMRQKFADIGVKNVDAAFEREDVKKLWKEYDAGLDTATFRARIRSTLQIPDAKDQQIDDAWNTMLGEIPAERMKLLKDLNEQKNPNGTKKYKVFLLSNCNFLHHPVIEAKYGAEFKKYFDKQYFSQIIGMKKPDRKIYEHVLADSKLKPSETIFFDDLLANVQGAIDAGMHSKQIDITFPETVVLDTIRKLDSVEDFKNYQKAGVVAGIAVTAIAGIFAVKKAAEALSAAPSAAPKPNM